jgi:hypothetical protein
MGEACHRPVFHPRGLLPVFCRVRLLVRTPTVGQHVDRLMNSDWNVRIP